MELSGTATLITGASRGLGEALARRARLGRGARVVLVSRHRAALEPVLRRIRDGGGEAHALEADLGAQRRHLSAWRAPPAALVGADRSVDPQCQ